MESKRPRGREKNVTGGSASVSKNDTAKNYGNTVGNAHGYQSRTESPDNFRRPGSQQGTAGNGPQRPNSGGRRSTAKRGGGLSIGTIAIIAIAYFLLKGGKAPDIANVAGTLLENNQQTVSQSYTATTAPVITATPRPTATPKPVSVLSGINNAGSAVTAVSGQARKKYTTLRGNGKDTVTMMVYMCGTDLESNYGMATNDLNEMLKAGISDKIQLIVETGGCQKWQNSVMSSSANQRYQVTGKGLVRLEENLGKRCMTDASTLTDFIQYCKKNYPADRYVLIMWDHGGGSISGYGYDQLFAAKGSMTLSSFSKALEAANCKFDFIGFDACLMATLETCVASEPYADYLIASEEAEPGIGWYYTDWLKLLSKNTSTPTVELGKEIIDSFVEQCGMQSSSDVTTLSIVDLAEFSGTVPSALKDFASATVNMVSSGSFSVLSSARANSREFSSSNRLDQVDFIDFLTKVGTEECNTLAKTLKSTVKYNRTSRNITNAYGISCYFPYKKVSNVSSALSIYDAIGMDEMYGDAIKDYASLMTGGQTAASSVGGYDMGSLLSSMLGYSGYGPAQSSGGSSYGSYGSSGAYGSYGYDTSSVDLSSLLGSFFGGSSGGSSGYDLSSLFGSSGGNSSYDLSSLFGGSDYSSLFGGRSMDWVNTELIQNNADSIARVSLADADFSIHEKNGQYVVELTDDQWNKVTGIALNVFLDDGDGFIDLGLDNVMDYTDEGDLLIDYDGTWLALDGHIVPYYVEDEVYEGDAYMIRGYVPAELTGSRVVGDEQVGTMNNYAAEGLADAQGVKAGDTVRYDNLRVELVLVFDDANPNGYVIGARRVYTDGETETKSKGIFNLENGDEIEFVCDYYNRDGSFNNNYGLKDKLVVNGDITIENMYIENGKALASYKFTDACGSEYWTPWFTKAS